MLIQALNPQDSNILSSKLLSSFPTVAHDSRSPRYQIVSTPDVVQTLADEGFKPVSFQSSRTKSPDDAPYTKHLIRFRHESDFNALDANELVFLNSYGYIASSAKLIAGYLRGACLNGLVFGTNTQHIKVNHSRKGLNDFLTAAYRVINSFNTTDEIIDRMKSRHLSIIDRYDLALSARSLRYAPNTPQPTLHALLEARRSEDTSTDLWTVFNVLQEHLVRGGTPIYQGRKPRALSSIDAGVKINKELWALAQSYV